MPPLVLIDLYCERTGPGFWNEPVNALSNLAFVIAALFALRALMRRGRADVLEALLVLLCALIGVGSFLFHTVADHRAELADVIPIWSFVALYVLTAIYRSTGESLWRTGRIALIAGGITGCVFWLTSGDVVSETNEVGPLNGSLQYLPALIALTVFAVVTTIRHHPAASLVQAATGVFLLSLMFRSVDLYACAPGGIGTHFLWHSLNAVMVGLLLFALIRHMPPQKAMLR